MNDDLNLVVTYLNKAKLQAKIAIKIRHGLNKQEWQDIAYFREINVHNMIVGAMPMHLASSVDVILQVEEINEVFIEPED